MKALVLFILILVLIGGGMKLAGQPLPFIDYKVGPIGWGPQHIELVPGSLKNGGGQQITIPLH
jgi:hypothetical protein